MRNPNRVALSYSGKKLTPQQRAEVVRDWELEDLTQDEIISVRVYLALGEVQPRFPGWYRERHSDAVNQLQSTHGALCEREAPPGPVASAG